MIIRIKLRIKAKRMISFTCSNFAFSPAVHELAFSSLSWFLAGCNTVEGQTVEVSLLHNLIIYYTLNEEKL